MSQMIIGRDEASTNLAQCMLFKEVISSYLYGDCIVTDLVTCIIYQPQKGSDVILHGRAEPEFPNGGRGRPTRVLFGENVC